LLGVDFEGVVFDVKDIVGKGGLDEGGEEPDDADGIGVDGGVGGGFWAAHFGEGGEGLEHDGEGGAEEGGEEAEGAAVFPGDSGAGAHEVAGGGVARGELGVLGHGVAPGNAGPL